MHQIPREEKTTMAQKVQTVFIDDLDGTEADGTVRFSLDGTEYEIDLNADHTQALREALAPYVDAGRRVSGSARRPVRPGRRPRVTRKVVCPGHDTG
jgi:Lsr2